MYESIVESAKRQESEAKVKLKNAEVEIANLQQNLKKSLKDLKVSDIESLTTLEQELKNSLEPLEMKSESLTAEKGEIDI